MKLLRTFTIRLLQKFHKIDCLFFTEKMSSIEIHKIFPILPYFYRYIEKKFTVQGNLKIVSAITLATDPSKKKNIIEEKLCNHYFLYIPLEKIIYIVCQWYKGQFQSFDFFFTVPVRKKFSIKNYGPDFNETLCIYRWRFVSHSKQILLKINTLLKCPVLLFEIAASSSFKKLG